MGTESTNFDDSQLLSGSYQTEDGELQITFVGGAEYAYFDVPQSVWEDLRDAGDPGDFFRQHVKGIYEYRRL